MYKIVSLALASCLTLSAQVIPNQPGQWVPDGFMLHEGFPCTGTIVDASDVIRLKLPSPIQRAPDAPNTMATGIHHPPFWARDHYYCVSFRVIQDKDKAPVQRTTLHRFETSGWKELGRLDTKPSVGTIKIIPCDQDRFIAISSKEDMNSAQNPRDRSPFYSLKLRENGEFVIGSRIDPECEPMGKEPDWFGLPALSPLIITEDHATLLHRSTGLYWVFSLQNGSLRRSGRMLPEITDEVIRKKEARDAILSQHPMPNQTILCLARAEGAPAGDTESPEKAVEKLMKEHPGMDAKDALRIYTQKKREQLETNPFPRWLALDPEKGTVARLIPPPLGAPDFLDSRKGVAWRPLPDGNLRYGRVVPKTEAPAPAAPRNTQGAAASPQAARE